MSDVDSGYADWYVWARRNLSNDGALCHAAAAAATDAEAAGGTREQAIAAARQSTTSGAHRAPGGPRDARRRTYAEWFDWARRELGGLREQQTAAAGAALAALEAGAGPEAAQRAAREAAGVAGPALPPAPAPALPPPAPAAVAGTGPPAPAWAPVPAYASVGLRLAAYAIDYAICLGTLLLLGVFAGASMGVAGALAGSPRPSTDALQVPVWLVSLAGPWLYYTLLESSGWQGTLGKRLLHLRVSDERGGRISWARANGRYFAKILSSLACGLGYLWAAFNPRRQGWHDLLAKTVVLRG